MIKKISFSLSLFSVFLLSFRSFASTKTSVATGNWNNSAIWSPSGVPSPTDDVVIQSAHKILLNTDATVHNLTINASGELNFSATKKLSLNGSLIVNGKLDMNGGDIFQNTINAQFTITNTGQLIWNPADNTPTGATLFTNSIENFSAQSTLVIKKWYSFTTVPLGSVVTGNFGNVTINTIVGGTLFEWDQKNQFELHKIIGTLTIDQGWVVLDKSGALSNTTIGSISLLNMNSFLDLHSGTHPGSFVVNTDSIKNVGGELNGIYNGNGNITLNVSGNFTNLGNVELIYNTGLPNTGLGNCTLNVGGKFKQSTGDFRGIFNLSTINAGNVTMSFGSIEQTGGVMIAYYACNSTGALNKVTVGGDLNVSLSNVNDKFRVNGLTSLMGQYCKSKSDLVINGSLNLSGLSTAEFTSSGSVGAEYVHISGDVVINGMMNSFNYGSHSTTLQFDSKLKIAGGTTYLSRFPGTTQITIENDLIVSSGILAVKGSTGTADVNLNGNYIQAGGTVLLHSNTTSTTSDVVNLILQGIFNQLNGTLNFDDNAASSATHQLYLKGNLFTVDGGAVITRAGAGIATTFGKLNFSKAGLIQYKRNSSTALLEQTKQSITAGCTVDMLVGNFQLASHQSPANDFLKISNGGTLMMHAAQVVTNFKAAHTGIVIEASGKLTTQNINGFYNSSGTATLKNAGNLTYYLDPISVIEYNGIATQTITGINEGVATNTQHKYGILKINFQGTPNSEFVKLVNSNVYVRNQLQLENGELNLNNNTITIESGNSSAVQKTNGYIKSEGELSILKWKNISHGDYLIPFALNNTTYLPIKFNPITGSGDASFSTYHSTEYNLPFPQNISSINIDDKDLSNSSAIDRWYCIKAPALKADLQLSYSANENTTQGFINDDLTVITSSSGSTWKNLNTQGKLVGNNIGVVTVNNASDVSNCVIILKKDFTETVFTLNATYENDLIKGNWIYSIEKPGDIFEVERSKDGQTFESIESRQGDGTGEYDFTDENALEKINYYYRIKYISPLGTTKYSNVVQINKTIASGLASLEILNIFPNPFTSTFTLQYDAGVAGEIKIELINEAGQMVFSNMQKCAGGSNTYTYPNQRPLPPGMYVVVLTGNKSRVSKKIYKK